MNRLGLEMLTLLGMPPAEHVRLASELGCAVISTGLTPFPLKMFGVTDFAPYPEWSLRDDPAVRSDMKAAMRDTGVRIGLGEGFQVGPDCSPSDFAADLDIMAELGAKCVNTVCMDDAMVANGAVKDGMAELAEMANERGLVFTMEYFPPSGLNSIERVLEVIDHIGADKAKLLIDSMHFFRTGGTIESLKALDPAMIGYVQLADSPAGPPGGDYMAEAMFERQVPGSGELPLRDFIAALPEDMLISVELPRLDELRGGMSPRDHAARCIAAARELGA